MTVVLAIETSCDDTAAAIVIDGTDVRSSVTSSQIDLHVRFGGVVPEIAGRAHVELLNGVVAEAVNTAGVEPEDIDIVAATNGPGLIGALLVGSSAAKALALAWHRPFVGINHMEGHVYAPRLDDPSIEFPYVTLLVSGGHTLLVAVRGHGEYELLGETVDDAAGEAFDKVSRYLGLGYPGGPPIEREAENGDPKAIAFPRGLANDGLNFSFSGVKTSVVNYVRKNPDVDTADVAASFQEAVVDVLVTKARRAADLIGAKGIAIGGGVAANLALRERLLDACIADNRQAYLPSREMCTDNAAMIASAAYWVARRLELPLNAADRLALEPEFAQNAEDGANFVHPNLVYPTPESLALACVPSLPFP
jgi:N6-L-threonylcarbamoyladenine synthase